MRSTNTAKKRVRDKMQKQNNNKNLQIPIKNDKCGFPIFRGEAVARELLRRADSSPRCHAVSPLEPPLREMERINWLGRSKRTVGHVRVSVKDISGIEEI